MLRNIGSVFSHCDIRLDGAEWIGCVFNNCRIFVSTGNFILTQSTLNGCFFQFEGEAQNIVDLIKLLDQSMEETAARSGGKWRRHAES